MSSLIQATDMYGTPYTTDRAVRDSGLILEPDVRREREEVCSALRWKKVGRLGVNKDFKVKD
jgi:hypothetical protein